MQKVLGVGGFFFRARDPQALKAWYAEHLGVTQTPSGYGNAYWVQQQGPTVFEPFPESTGYFGEASHQWMINFRVADLPAMVSQLRQAGIAVEVDPTEYPNGHFARLRDPEGNPVALWQPKENELDLPPEGRT